MPELPEIETIKKDLKNLITGLTVAKITILRSSIFVSAVDEIKKFLPGKKVTKVARRAKLLLFKIDNLWLVSHLRMSGAYLFEDNRQKTSADKDKSTRFIIYFKGFKGAKRLIYQDQRALGRIYLFDEAGRRAFFNNYGIEPFSAKFTVAELSKKMKRRRVNVKQFLLDQREIVGIGNIYASEILFRAKVNPLTPAIDLSAAQIKQLRIQILDVLRKAIIHQGTTISDYRQTSGAEGSFQNFLKIYGREAQPCLNCQTAITRVMIQNRSTYYCPYCQP